MELGRRYSDSYFRLFAMSRYIGVKHQWSSGRIHRCHRCDPGSIPSGHILRILANGVFRYPMSNYIGSKHGLLLEYRCHRCDPDSNPDTYILRILGYSHSAALGFSFNCPPEAGFLTGNPAATTTTSKPRDHTT